MGDRRGSTAPSPAHDDSDRRSLAHRVRTARRRAFVGRADQLALFDRALRGEPDAPRVLLVHGPGGIGKSALLRRFVDEAQSRGRIVVVVDGESVGVSTETFERLAGPVLEAERPVLVVDGFEHCQVLEGWLREELLPCVPEDTVVVVAGRTRPEPQWSIDAGWRELTHVEQLPDLDPDDADALLVERGVAEPCRRAITRFAGGHPSR